MSFFETCKLLLFFFGPMIDYYYILLVMLFGIFKFSGFVLFVGISEISFKQKCKNTIY